MSTPHVADATDAVNRALSEEMAVYAARNSRSRDRFAEATAVMPGGNTRSVLYYEPFPLSLVRGHDCRLWDADELGPDVLAEIL